MELINTKDLYENDAFVIIEAEFEDSETKKRMQEISLGLKNNQGDITKIRTIHRTNIAARTFLSKLPFIMISSIVYRRKYPRWK